MFSCSPHIDICTLSSLGNTGEALNIIRSLVYGHGKRTPLAILNKKWWTKAQ